MLVQLQEDLNTREMYCIAESTHWILRTGSVPGQKEGYTCYRGIPMKVWLMTLRRGYGGFACSLVIRWLKGDQIETYKTFTRLNMIDAERIYGLGIGLLLSCVSRYSEKLFCVFQGKLFHIQVPQLVQKGKWNKVHKVSKPLVSPRSSFKNHSSVSTDSFIHEIYVSVYCVVLEIEVRIRVMMKQSDWC